MGDEAGEEKPPEESPPAVAESSEAPPEAPTDAPSSDPPAEASEAPPEAPEGAAEGGEPPPPAPEGAEAEPGGGEQPEPEGEAGSQQPEGAPEGEAAAVKEEVEEAKPEGGEEAKPEGEEGATDSEAAEAKDEVPELPGDKAHGKSAISQKSETEAGERSRVSIHAPEEEPVSSEFVGQASYEELERRESKPEHRRSRMGSKAQRVLGSTISIRRLSGMGDMYDRKGARYANTYKLESDNPFNVEKVHKILVSVMTEAVENMGYDPDICAKQAKWASSAIRSKVKDLEFDRYKLVCLVTIGEKNSQDLIIACRFLWDPDRDRYAVFSLENTFIFGVAQCFGLYYE